MISSILLREFRARKLQHGILLLNLVLGMVGLMCVFLMNFGIGSYLSQSAQKMLGADLVVYARREFTPAEIKELNSELGEHVEFLELYSMVTGKKSRLSLIKAYPEEYPFYGEILTPLKKKLVPGGVILSPDLKRQLQVENGEMIKVGENSLKVLDEVSVQSTFSVRGFNLAPVMLMHKKDLEKTGLVKFGSTVTRGWAYRKVSEDQVKRLELKLKDPGVSFVTPKRSNDQISRLFNYLSDYLGLAALTSFLLSLFATFYLFESKEIQMLSSTGALELLGLNKKFLLKKFLAHYFFWSSIALIISGGCYFILEPIMLEKFQDLFGVPLEVHWNSDIFILITIIYSLVLSLIFPLARKIYYIPVLNKLTGNWHLSWNKKELLVFLPFILLFTASSIYLSHSLRTGMIFVSSILVSMLFLVGIFKLGMMLLGKINFTGLSNRLSVRYLSRNWTQVIFAFLSMALGLLLLFVILNIENSIKTELKVDREDQASLFIFDIQDEEVQSVKSLIQDLKAKIQILDPMIRAKISEHNGKPYIRDMEEGGFETRERENERRFKNRMVNLTYKSVLNSSEKITQGEAFSFQYSGQGDIPLSLEEKYADRMGFKLGDKISFDVMGIGISGVVKNFRSVKWTTFQPNFFIVFPEGVLEDAPKTYLLSLSKMDQEKQYLIQDKIVEKFSHISVINVTDLVDKIVRIIELMGSSLKVVGLFSLAIGLLLLSIIVTEQIRSRKNDIHLLHLLGMDSKKLMQLFKREFLILAGAALVSSWFISLAVSGIFGHFVFETYFVLNLKENLILIGIFVFLNTLLVDLTLRVLFKNR